MNKYPRLRDIDCRRPDRLELLGHLSALMPFIGWIAIQVALALLPGDPQCGELLKPDWFIRWHVSLLFYLPGLLSVLLGMAAAIAGIRFKASLSTAEGCIGMLLGLVLLLITPIMLF